MIEVNVNSYVYVKLTAIGREELKRQHKQRVAASSLFFGDYEPKMEDENGYSKWLLHELMNTFGHMLICGFNIPFETNIRFDEYRVI